ncbi:fumarylacetoacetate hydrolase family protein [Bacillus alkalicellulosilyticus]|uniref:fumarylacetoacetate hydrolase family protein n=1 Tax=Alkalihalobacterium alkalicellulosilyticum TaxID=1912214 RepID=UPI0009960F79|nr:fumarylacetoacetate hydrolase family protein [Bacillus alkalicellulosilyticus]
MRVIRFQDEEKIVVAAVTDEDQVFALPFTCFLEISHLADERETTVLNIINEVINDSVPLDVQLKNLHLLVPIEAPEVWAAGVTYLKSKEARNYEATGGKLDANTFYDKVYDAERPELFFKSTSARTVGPKDIVYLRTDSNWQIPEPELGLVINNQGKILGYLAGNDMSSRDIEGENPLYLPQAKVWRHSCSIGPAIRLAETVENPYEFEIACRIYRNHEKVFDGSASTGQLKRTFDELVSFLTLDNQIFDGTVLLTGTCIVPPNEFTLAADDRIEIEISGIGILENLVKTQIKQEGKIMKN